MINAPGKYSNNKPPPEKKTKVESGQRGEGVQVLCQIFISVIVMYSVRALVWERRRGRYWTVITSNQSDRWALGSCCWFPCCWWISVWVSTGREVCSVWWLRIGTAGVYLSTCSSIARIWAGIGFVFASHREAVRFRLSYFQVDKCVRRHPHTPQPLISSGGTSS